jgi:hypothetical protein
MFTQLEMPPEDKKLIINFTKKVKKWAPDSLTSIILYGSVAKGFFPRTMILI